MAERYQGRWRAQIEGDFVVFLIGTSPSLLHPIRWFQDVGGRRGMQHMLTYLAKQPEKGLLAFEVGVPFIVQYWRSFEHLEAFARDEKDPHLAAWRRYWKRVGKDNRSGIWHETYLVRAGEYEAVYANMRRYGLARAGELEKLGPGSRARTRLGGGQARSAEPSAERST